MAANNILATLINGFGTFLMFAAEVTLLVIALTTVKTRRPDAFLPIAASAGIHLFGTIVSSLVHAFVTPALVRSGSIENLPTIYAVIGFVFTSIHLVGWGALIFGVLRLANGPRPNDPTRYG